MPKKKEVVEKEEVIRKRIPVSQFIQAWQTSDSLNEVAEELGITSIQARARAIALRAKGVKALKKFARKKLNYSALNEQAESLI